MEDAQFAAVLGAPLIELLDCNLALANPSPSPSPNPSPNPSQVLECHLTAPFRLARAAADHMRALDLPLSPFISLYLPSSPLILQTVAPSTRFLRVHLFLPSFLPNPDPDPNPGPNPHQAAQRALAEKDAVQKHMEAQVVRLALTLALAQALTLTLALILTLALTLTLDPHPHTRAHPVAIDGMMAEHLKATAP